MEPLGGSILFTTLYSHSKVGRTSTHICTQKYPGNQSFGVMGASGGQARIVMVRVSVKVRVHANQTGTVMCEASGQNME